MNLYYQTHSPYARKVLVLIHELGIFDQTHVTHYETSPTEKNATVFAKNPLGKVPILIDGKQTLFDSAIICRYLLEKYNDQDNHASRTTKPTYNLEDLQLEALATGIADAGILARWEQQRRPKDKRYEPFLNGQLLKLTQAYDYLENLNLSTEGQYLAFGEIALASSLTWIEYVALPSFSDGRPTLHNWYQSFCKRASMTKTAYSGTTLDLKGIKKAVS
jgi:glutathione S-transferase